MQVHQLLSSMRTEMLLRPPALTSNFQIAVLAAASCFLLGASSVSAGEELPCADDCIAAFELLWIGNESEIARRSAINDITDELVRRGYEDLSGVAIQQARYVFVAFKKHCSEKEAILSDLLVEVFGFLQPGIGFRVMNEHFDRGPNTIEFYGEHWNESPCCRNR